MKEGRQELPAGAPEELQQAEQMLDAAIMQVLQLSEQIALWRAIRADKGLHERLGYSGVGAATRTVFLALQSSIMLGLARAAETAALSFAVAPITERRWNLATP